MTDDLEQEIDVYQTCLFLIERGRAALLRSNFDMADKALDLVAQTMQEAPSRKTEVILPLALCYRSLLERRRGNAAEAADLRTRATPLVEAIPLTEQSVPFHNLMLNALIDLAEYRRAIPFCEQAIQMISDRNDPLALVDLLSREGLCYARSGLKEHAAIILRAALKILRSFPGDPRLPAVLISLGNALRKSSPVEAEQLYKEAAAVHEAKAQMESATTAWINLGILCSEQGLHTESLDYYKRALRVREGAPATPPDRIGSLLNNMANGYRRKGEFDEALRLVDRAIGTLKPSDGSLLASAYGTRGQILHDANRDTEAVEWLQKSYAERQKASSPDLDAIIENLEREIESLQRLGNTQEMLAAEQRLAHAKTQRKKRPGSI